MNALLTAFRAHGASNARLIAGPLLIVMVLAMMVLPLPPFLLDMFFTFNIALAIMVLLVAMFTTKPLDFAAFPSVLLFATLLRLSLNVASTRVILLHGHTGPDAAGRVIEAFGHFLVGGNFAVGIVVFLILIVINFMVITKGAGRIAEVGARFTLDAMPGKQMAIDADLNAGLIGEEEARDRRRAIAEEADFYGSMDGASKFVRGDAVAGIIIMAITIVGGLIVGMMQHGMSAGDAARTYTLLTIGDGLVAQIPALVISTAAGVVVSRVATDKDIGQQMASQLFSNPSVLFITAGVMGMIGIIPNMPHLAFLSLAAALAGIGEMLRRRQALAAAASAQPQADSAVAAEVAAGAAAEASWDDVAMVDPLGLEVGYRLIPLVDMTQGGELLQRIRSLRKKFAQDVGFLPPVVHIRDNLELKPAEYRILLSGVEVGRGEAMAGMWLAIDPGGASASLQGTATTDPAFGLPAVWIDEGQRDMAQMAGYTVVDASTVAATHLNHLMHRYAAELFGRTEVQQLVERITKDAPKLTEDLVPKTVTLTTLQKVLQGLLQENVPIRDMRSIIDVLAEHAPRLSANGATPDAQELIALVRRALGRSMTQQLFPGHGEMRVIALDAHLERVLTQAMGAGGALEPGLAESLLREAETAVQHQEAAGDPAVLMVSQPVRASLSRFLRLHLPQLTVLANAEVPDDRSIRVTAVMGGNSR